MNSLPRDLKKKDFLAVSYKTAFIIKTLALSKLLAKCFSTPFRVHVIRLPEIDDEEF